MSTYTITSVPGFRAAGVPAGLKGNNELDIALVVSDVPAAAAATFTKNLVQAAPVLYDKSLLARNHDNIRAVVVNSKNANAVTGPQGLKDAESMGRITGETLGLDETAGIFVMSTGVIGVPMPMETIAAGIEMAAGHLAATSKAGTDAAQAIMTTDTHHKVAGTQVELDGAEITIAGMAKGAGMIHPNMGTMLACVATDAPVVPALLDAALQYAVERTFNCISVDGDTSTNDTCLVLANGVAAIDPIAGEDDARFAAFREALLNVLRDLAQQIAFDGEGATKHVTIEVQNAGSFEAARQIGRTIATSPLTKTALYGRDANWGRVLAAAGRAGVDFDPDAASLWFGDLQLLNDGVPVGIDEGRALAILSEVGVTITLDVGGNAGEATVWTCDFSHEYVTINAEYRT